jgi:hypothetical protein
VTVLNLSVGASADDATAWPTTGFTNNNATLFLGNDGGANYNGLRFTNVTIAAGATINSASLSFVASQTRSADTVRLKITYQDADAPANFSADDNTSFMARTRSATGVDWDFTTDWTAGTTYTSVDISTVIQALVDEAYWASGEACVIFVDDDGSSTNGLREAASQDHITYAAPTLDIDYTAGTTTPQAVAGTLTSAGAPAMRTGKPVAGSLSSAGPIAKLVAKPLAGALSSAGVVAKQAATALAGTLTSAGALTRQTGKALSGALTSAGALTLQGQKALSGALTSAGALTNQTAKVLAGALTSAGDLASELISGAQQYLQEVSGGLASSGALVQQAGKALGGTLASAGEVVKRTAINAAGTLSTAGTVAKRAAIAIGGAIAGAGDLAAVGVAGAVALAGTLAMGGELSRVVGKALTGLLSSVGALETLASAPRNQGRIDKGSFKAVRRMYDRARR